MANKKEYPTEAKIIEATGAALLPLVWGGLVAVHNADAREIFNAKHSTEIVFVDGKKSVLNGSPVNLRREDDHFVVGNLPTEK